MKLKTVSGHSDYAPECYQQDTCSLVLSTSIFFWRQLLRTSVLLYRNSNANGTKTFEPTKFQHENVKENGDILVARSIQYTCCIIETTFTVLRFLRYAFDKQYFKRYKPNIIWPVFSNKLIPWIIKSIFNPTHLTIWWKMIKKSLFIQLQNKKISTIY